MTDWTVLVAIFLVVLVLVLAIWKFDTLNAELSIFEWIKLKIEGNQQSYKPKGNKVDLSKYYYIISKQSGKCLDVGAWHTDNGTQVHLWLLHGGNNQKWRFSSTEAGYFQIVSKLGNICLDVDTSHDSGKTDGAKIHMWDLHPGHNQQWSLVPVENGYYHIRARHSGKCIDVEGGKDVDGTRIQQWGCHSGNNQKWRLVPVSIFNETWLKLRNKL